MSRPFFFSYKVCALLLASSSSFSFVCVCVCPTTLRCAVSPQVRYKRALNPDAKLSVHERALGLGADDQLKTDYSRFLPKKKQRTLTNVVPLTHGHLTNTLVFRAEVLHKSAIRVQNYYRAVLARRQAEVAARRKAFYAARAVALDEARKAVESEFEAKEALEGTAKLKWDSKLRLRMSKMAAAGKAVDRAAVLALYLDEAITAKEGQVKQRFLEMAIHRGFEKDPRHHVEEEEKARKKKKDEEEAEAEANPLAEDHGHKTKAKRTMAQKLLGDEVVELLDGEIITPRAAGGGGPSRPETTTGHTGEPLLALENGDAAGPEGVGGGTGEGGGAGEGGEGGSRPTTGGEGGGGKKGRKRPTPYGHLAVTPKSLTTERRALMLMGSHPPELCVGRAAYSL